MFGDMKNNPKSWPIKSFSEMSEIITDGEHATPKRATQGIYLLSARNVMNHHLQLDQVDYIDELEYGRIAKRIIPSEGDILISCSGTVGRCCVIPANFKCQMVRSVALIRFNKKINPIFAEYMITSEDLQRQIGASKTASSQANLFQGKIAKLQGFIPDEGTQLEFVDFVKQVDKSKVGAWKFLPQGQHLSGSLTQKCFG
jgi:type I restriction enzyme S subunit